MLLLEIIFEIKSVYKFLSIWLSFFKKEIKRNDLICIKGTINENIYIYQNKLNKCYS